MGAVNSKQFGFVTDDDATTNLPPERIVVVAAITAVVEAKIPRMISLLGRY
jgi:hypothetical protein